jgi:coenzyme F420-0:L-glutamate ligase/coenzyme F420-1:gamma-L-glutamate ligase
VDAPSLVVTALVGMPEVREGDDLAELLAGCLAGQGLSLEPGDVVVVASKVVSKALGLRRHGRRADVVASQTRRVVAERATGDGPTQVVVSAAGPVMAAAGVDASNAGPDNGVLVLPEDPDAVAADLRGRVLRACGLEPSAPVGVVLTDTAGRPWREGQVDFAIGAAGVAVVEDLRGSVDADGRPLSVTTRALADEVAAAADLVKGKASGIPAVLVRGSGLAVGANGSPAAQASDVVARPRPDESAGAASLIRTGPTDWFDYGRAEAVRASLGVEPGSPAAAQVGLPAVWPEPPAARVARAVAVALYGLPHAGAQVAVDVAVAAPDGAADLQVTAQDPFSLGVAVTRLGVALWGEDVAVDYQVVTDTRALLRLRGRERS